MDPIEELRERMAAIEAAAHHHVGVSEYEHQLVDLLALLDSDRVTRATAVSALTMLATEWPWGAVETLEFCLRSLRWEELRRVLVAQRETNPDFRYRNLAGQVLEVYTHAWPAGEIYATYRLPG